METFGECRCNPAVRREFVVGPSTVLIKSGASIHTFLGVSIFGRGLPCPSTREQLPMALPCSKAAPGQNSGNMPRAKLIAVWIMYSPREAAHERLQYP